MDAQSRCVVHLDLDAFFAAVEVLEDPSLAGRPLIIGGRPEERGVVASASYEARAYGVRSAMPTYRALALLRQAQPGAVLRPTRHGVYGGYSRRVMDILRQSAPLMEQTSIDEAYLELTELLGRWEEGTAIARQIQQRVRDEVGLSASLGVATNKLLAKVASDHDKPGGLTVVPPGGEATFLAPLPARVLWGVGPVTAARLAEMGVQTVGDLAGLSAEDLQARFGQHGLALAEQARGLDQRPLIPEHEIKSISQETTFARDLVDPQAVNAQLVELCQGLARRLQSQGLAAGTVSIKMRYSDFDTVTRQMALAVPTADAETLLRAARVLLRRTWRGGRPVRLLGVAGQRLSAPTGQLPLL